MKVKVMKSIKKVAAVATGALFVGATMGVAAVFGSGLGSLPSTFIHNGAVNAVVVVGSTAQPIDILGSIDVASALTAAAAAQHTSTSGVVTIGALSLSSSAQASLVSSQNATTFGAFTPSSAYLNRFNFSYGRQSVALQRPNYTAVENITFSKAPYFNGLNVVFPAGSYNITSYVVNRSHSNAIVPLMDNLQYLIGNKSETLINFTTAANGNFTVGQVQTYVDQKVPATITLGTHTIGLLGIATIGGGSASSSYNQLEFNVNGGATNYMNFSKTVTTGGVTLTLGSSYITNTSGTFLTSLGISSSSLVQRTNNSANAFGLGAYNFSSGQLSAGTKFLNFTSEAKQTLTASFSAVSSFGVVGLSNISLQKLTHVYTANKVENLTVNVGAAGSVTLTPINLSASVTGMVYLRNGTDSLPAVQFGTDFRGAAPSASPDFALEPFQTIRNLSGTFNYSSEYMFPFTNNAHTYAQYTGASTSAFSYKNANTTSQTPLLFVLPNGKSFAIQFNVVHAWSGGTAHNTSEYISNATTLWNGSYNVAPINVKMGGNYSFGGFNLSFVNKTLSVSNATAGVIATKSYKVSEVKVTGPKVSVSNTASSAVALNYNIVPGFTKLYLANGSSYTSAPIGTGGYLGTLSFDGSKLVYTEPMTGGTQSVSIVENHSSFFTNVSTPTNTSADAWGAYVKGASVHGATFVIPTQNYTLALGGSTVVGSEQNYSAGQTIPNGGKVISVGGAAGFTASSLFGTNVFPIGTEDSSFTGSSASVPVIVVGGPSVNTLAQTLLGVPAGSYGAGFTNKTGVTSGESLVQLFSNVSSLNNESALVIAGYSGEDTLQASEVVAESLLGTPIVTLNGTKMILTSGSSYTGVTVKSTS